jgi:hypothetical protein
MRSRQPLKGQRHPLGPGFGIRPPDAIVDIHGLERAVAGRDPDWYETPLLDCPLPNEAVDAFEFAAELWR